MAQKPRRTWKQKKKRYRPGVDWEPPEEEYLISLWNQQTHPLKADLYVKFRERYPKRTEKSIEKKVWDLQQKGQIQRRKVMPEISLRSRAMRKRKRGTLRQEHYDMLKALKELGKPAGFKELCDLFDPPKVNLFFREAVAWGMVQPAPRQGHLFPGITYTVTPVGEAFLRYIEEQE